MTEQIDCLCVQEFQRASTLTPGIHNVPTRGPQACKLVIGSTGGEQAAILLHPRWGENITHSTVDHSFFVAVTVRLH